MYLFIFRCSLNDVLFFNRGECGAQFSCHVPGPGAVIWESDGDRRGRSKSKYVGSRKTECDNGMKN